MLNTERRPYEKINRYNSVIFQRLGSTEYAIAVVSSDFSHGSSFDLDAVNTLDIIPSAHGFVDSGLLFNETKEEYFTDGSIFRPPRLDPQKDKRLLLTLQTLAVQGNLIRKTQENCITAYGNPLEKDYRNILAVSETAAPVNSCVYWLEKSSPLDDGPTDWTCRYMTNNSRYIYGENKPIYSNCTTGSAEKNSSHWAIGYSGLLPLNSTTWSLRSYSISHCFVEGGPPKLCSLHYNLCLLIIVTAANAIKIGVMIITLLKFNSSPLVTLGDAIASFLQCPDINTRGMCLLGHELFDAPYNNSTHMCIRGNPWVPQAKRYSARNCCIRNVHSPSGREWFVIVNM